MIPIVRAEKNLNALSNPKRAVENANADGNTKRGHGSVGEKMLVPYTV